MTDNPFLVVYYAYREKEVETMPTEKEVLIIQKATIYDLQRIMERSGKESYTAEEIKELMDAYIKGAEQ